MAGGLALSLAEVTPEVLHATPLPALADGGVTVKLPDPGQIAAAASPDFLMALVMANVAGMNCPGHALSDGEWALVTGTADRVAGALKIGASAYDEDYYGPAFAAMDKLSLIHI